MIDVDKLRNITHLVTHGPACSDGYASALIVKDALSNVRVSFMAYNTAKLAALKAEPGLLFVDFTPPRERVAEFVAAGAIVLDHHPTAKDIVEAFGEDGVFGLNDKNQCGAWLAYEHVWKPLYDAMPVEQTRIHYPHVRDFALRAAIRDTWKKHDPLFQRARDEGELMLFWRTQQPLSYYAGAGDERSPLAVRLFQRAEDAANKSLDESHLIITGKGTEVWMFQGVSTTSDAAELAEKAVEKTLHHQVGPSQPDLVVGFHYKVDGGKLKLQFSTRSHTGFDCAAFAKAHPGGGGHRAAAGFTIEVSPELSANPYQTFRLLLEQWESR